MNIWRLITHHEQPEEVVQWSREKGRIAIGWGLVGDLSLYSSPKEIADAIKQFHPKRDNAGLGGPSLWHFYHDMQIGDLVILSTGKNGGRRLVMRVQGPYEYVRKEEERPLYKAYRDDPSYHHQRGASVTSYDPNELWEKAGAKEARGDNIRWTLIRCLRPVDQL